MARLILRLATLLCALVALAGCTSTPVQSSAPTTREFYVFSSSMSWDEGTNGLPHDQFAPSTLVVNKGDTVVIHFFNTENATTTQEHHSFTMAAPFNVNLDIGPESSANATLNATAPGIYDFLCSYHQPTMRGQLVVLG